MHNTVFAHPTIQQHLNSDWIILSNQIVFKILRFNLKEVLTGYGAGGVKPYSGQPKVFLICFRALIALLHIFIQLFTRFSYSSLRLVHLFKEKNRI